MQNQPLDGDDRDQVTPTDYLESKGVRSLGDVSEASPERTRHHFVTWSLATFSGTVCLSGLLMGAVSLSCSSPDYQPIKDWTNMMVTAQIGIMGAAGGYYFGTNRRTEE